MARGMRQSPWKMVACPTCGAPVGCRCWKHHEVSGGIIATHVHVARVKLAKQQFKPSGEGYARVR